MSAVTAYTQSLLACRRCPRMRAQFKRLRLSLPDYWNQPVPPSGPAESPLLIVGLAPGKHGANRTGLPFTGDASGDLLFAVLEELGLQQQVRITNAVKCLPIANLPSTSEIVNCQRHLKPELTPGLILLCLGGVAHRATIRALGARQSENPFEHGRIHSLATVTLVDSYHCSRYNTQTRRLTQNMFRDVVELAAGLAGMLKARK
ncbi:MAG: uracil-DNA glycosylase family protein [Pseudomonadota bacterium]